MSQPWTAITYTWSTLNAVLANHCYFKPVQMLPWNQLCEITLSKRVMAHFTKEYTFALQDECFWRQTIVITADTQTMEPLFHWSYVDTWWRYHIETRSASLVMYEKWTCHKELAMGSVHVIIAVSWNKWLNPVELPVIRDPVTLLWCHPQ